jgi:hypothetical protein
MDDPALEMSRNAEVLTGHLPEYGELLDLLAERPGLVVISGDPMSGTSALLATATSSLPGAYVALDDEAGLVIDHLGLMLSAMPADEVRAFLAELRAARQRHPRLDLILVEHSEGPIGKALADHDHPMFQAGQQVLIRRPSPSRFVADLAVVRAWSEVPVELLGAAAELVAGVPALTWRVVELSPDGAGAVVGWRRLRRATQAGTERQWDLLRRVHPQAQPVVAVMGAGLGPHAVSANAKSINDALNRLRGLGMAWQPEARSWSLSDPFVEVLGTGQCPIMGEAPQPVGLTRRTDPCRPRRSTRSPGSTGSRPSPSTASTAPWATSFRSRRWADHAPGRSFVE